MTTRRFGGGRPPPPPPPPLPLGDVIKRLEAVEARQVVIEKRIGERFTQEERNTAALVKEVRDEIKPLQQQAAALWRVLDELARVLAIARAEQLGPQTPAPAGPPQQARPGPPTNS